MAQCQERAQLKWPLSLGRIIKAVHSARGPSSASFLLLEEEERVEAGGGEGGGGEVVGGGGGGGCVPLLHTVVGNLTISSGFRHSKTWTSFHLL